jgi:hypothetical protein|nr:MAG TPA: chromatin structure-remodeling complex protein [Bacteriophage sp.]
MISSPCKDCKSRFVGCHSTCDSYKEYRVELGGVKKKQRIETMICDYSCSRKVKS